MCTLLFFSSFLIISLVKQCGGQVMQFGKCAEVETKKYFDLESFLGQWYEIERFPIWYEHNGACAFKRIEYCARRVEIESGYVRDNIQYKLHVNSTYVPGDEAVFTIKENNIDPVGIPLEVISTDYKHYAVLHGCKYKEDLRIKYITAWILSRERTLSDELLSIAHSELKAIPYANLAYLEKVVQNVSKCEYHWTANIDAEYYDDDDDK